jgi:hypothetical protein
VREQIKIQKKVINLLYLSMVFMIVCMFGMLFNFLAVTKNEGRMPVLSSYSYSTQTHYTYSENNEVNLPYFTDRFNINGDVHSIGDLLMSASFLGIIINSVFLIKQENELAKLKRRTHGCTTSN